MHELKNVQLFDKNTTA